MVRQLADQSPILGTTITISRLKKRGYIAMLELTSTNAQHKPLVV
jgi:hypothetical protein